MTLLAFARDKSGPKGVIGTGELIARAASRITGLGLKDAENIRDLREQDPEVADVGRRLLWVLLILDRFHASSSGSDPRLPVFCGTVTREDYQALGEMGYHLAREFPLASGISILGWLC